MPEAFLFGTPIALQFFNYRGYLKFNRSQLQQDLDELGDAFKKELGIRRSALPSGREVYRAQQCTDCDTNPCRLTTSFLRTRTSSRASSPATWLDTALPKINHWKQAKRELLDNSFAAKSYPRFA